MSHLTKFVEYANARMAYDQAEEMMFERMER